MGGAVEAAAFGAMQALCDLRAVLTAAWRAAALDPAAQEGAACRAAATTGVETRNNLRPAADEADHEKERHLSARY